LFTRRLSHTTPHQVPKRLAAFQDCLQYFQRLHAKLFEFESKQLEDQIKLLEIQINMEVRLDCAFNA
jgi:hypothetical protein